MPVPPRSAAQIEKPASELTPAIVRTVPTASPSVQPFGSPSISGSGWTSSSNGAMTKEPVSAPVSSWNQATPLPSRVGRPSVTPTGSWVTWRRHPCARSHAWSW